MTRLEIVVRLVAAHLAAFQRGGVPIGSVDSPVIDSGLAPPNDLYLPAYFDLAEQILAEHKKRNEKDGRL